MNMLIGILCEVVSAVADAEKEATAQQRLEEHVKDLAEILDTDDDRHISKAEFQKLLTDPDLTQKLQDCGVDVIAVADFASFVFREVDTISYQDFRHMIIQFRGAKVTTVKDLMDTRKHFALELSFFESRLNDQLSALQGVQGAPQIF